MFFLEGLLQTLPHAGEAGRWGPHPTPLRARSLRRSELQPDFG